MLKLVAIVFLLGVCSAVGDQCCTPKQWEGVLTIQNVTTAKDKINVMTTQLMQSYDVDRQKLVYRGANSGVNYKIVQDYNKMIEYTIAVGACRTRKLTGKMSNCVPANATILASIEMGGPDGIKLDVYDLEVFAPGMGYKGSFTFNHEGCIPFGEQIVTDKWFATIGFSNITPGIKDPSVFDVPSPPCPRNADNVVNSLEQHPALAWPLPPPLP